MTHVESHQGLGTGSLVSVSDSATGVFVPVNYPPNPSPLPSYPADLQASVGSCAVTVSRIDRSIHIVQPPPPANPPPPQVFLDAGPFLTITDTTPTLTQVMKELSQGIYNATTISTTIGIPGLPPTTTVSPYPLYLFPGPFTLDNGVGGADIGPFVAPLVNPTPVNWTNLVVGASIDRTQGTQLTWTGGDPNGVVAITGESIAQAGTVSYSGFFYCFANASDGQFTVPPFITSQLPATGPAVTGGLGILEITALIDQLITTVPGIDLISYFSQQAVGATVVYQ